MITNKFLENWEQYATKGEAHEKANNDNDSDLLFRVWAEKYAELHQRVDKFVRSVEQYKLEKSMWEHEHDK